MGFLFQGLNSVMEVASSRRGGRAVRSVFAAAIGRYARRLDDFSNLVSDFVRRENVSDV